MSKEVAAVVHVVLVPPLPPDILISGNMFKLNVVFWPEVVLSVS